MPWLRLLILCWIQVLRMGILAFFLDLRSFQLFTDDSDVRDRLFIYDLYYIAITSFYFYFVEYFCHESLVNLLDTLWTSDEAQMKFHIFLILIKLCNAPSGSSGVDETEITFHFSFGNPCPCHSLSQNSVCLIRMPRVWKHLPTKTLILIIFQVNLLGWPSEGSTVNTRR